MKLRILHFSDLHLEASFAWMGSTATVARKRRRAQRSCLESIVRLAEDLEVDAITCGGDLFELENQSPQTGRFLCEVLESIHPCPIFIAPGNHDWLSPESLYRQVDWSPNVHIFNSSKLEPVSIKEGFTLWGAAHMGPARTENFLRNFKVPPLGIHVALFHGSYVSVKANQAEREHLHAPFCLEDLEGSGLSHALLGHYHAPQLKELYTYPGNPEPLSFGEDGTRGAVLFEIDDTQNIRTEHYRVSSTDLHDLKLNLSGHHHIHSLEEEIRTLLMKHPGWVRITLWGEQDPNLCFSLRDFSNLSDEHGSFKIELGDIVPAIDLEVVATENTVRGHFVREVQSSDLSEERKLEVLSMGLKALGGRVELEVGEL